MFFHSLFTVNIYSHSDPSTYCKCLICNSQCNVRAGCKQPAAWPPRWADDQGAQTVKQKPLPRLVCLNWRPNYSSFKPTAAWKSKLLTYSSAKRQTLMFTFLSAEKKCICSTVSRVAQVWISYLCPHSEAKQITINYLGLDELWLTLLHKERLLEYTWPVSPYCRWTLKC